MTHKRTLMTLGATGSLLAALTLAGCGRHDDSQTAAGARADATTAQADRRADDVRADASKSMKDAGKQVAQAGRDMREAGRSAADATTDAVSDAAITTSVSTELAKDPKLSALAIDVDTSAGRVALHGSAPDAAAKTHATQLAQGVKGVQGVDNELTIKQARP